MVIAAVALQFGAGKMTRGEPHHFENTDSFGAITLSMLSMLDGGNWVNLCSIIDDDRKASAIMQALGGTTMRIPTIGEYAAVMRAAVYAFFMLYISAKPGSPGMNANQYRATFGLTEDDYKAVRSMYLEWVKWLQSNNIDPRVFGKFKQTSKAKGVDADIKLDTRGGLGIPECLADYEKTLRRGPDVYHSEAKIKRRYKKAAEVRKKAKAQFKAEAQQNGNNEAN